jgi:hypothetical protein
VAFADVDPTAAREAAAAVGEAGVGAPSSAATHRPMAPAPTTSSSMTTVLARRE